MVLHIQNKFHVIPAIGFKDMFEDEWTIPNQSCNRIKITFFLSHEVLSGSDKMLCNKIVKPLAVYRFSNVM